MNVTELARRLHTNTKQLLEILPEYGFDIGKKAIKIDDRAANQVMKKWQFIKRDIEDKARREAEELKQKEKELRRQEGKSVQLPYVITVRDFAERLEMSVTQVMIELMKSGILANQNQNIDYDTAAIISEDLGFTPQKENKEVDTTAQDEDIKTALESALSKSVVKTSRAPVVVIMGHVDHGKTTLLDTIRKANIVSTESGGITQHIGAYQTIWKDPKNKEERKLTFIDTPGHEAFTVMRSRGAKVADIAILIVSADDSVKPQTKEAIQILKAAKLPIIVAVNKIDKDGADPQRVRTDLSKFNLIPEEWGGNTPMVDISAKQKLNIDKLLDVLLLVADVNEDKIKADFEMAAVGTVIESHVDKSIGPVATVLVQAGTLHRGDALTVNGEIYGKVRAMKDYAGENITFAEPSVPAQIVGFKVAPEVGDILDNTREAGAEKIDVKQKRTEQTSAVKHTITEAMGDENDKEDHGKHTLNLLIKADVLGSLEAIIGSLEKLKHDDVGIKIIGRGLGNIIEDDVKKAEAGEGTIVGFHVKATVTAEEHMQEAHVPFKQYDVIYDLINWVKEELEHLLDVEKVVTELGIVKVLAIFRKDKNSMIIGGRVEDGKVLKDSLFRIKHDGEIIGDGKIILCKTGKQEVKIAKSGTECGLQIESKVRIEEDDILEVYSEENKSRKIVFE